MKKDTDNDLRESMEEALDEMAQENLDSSVENLTERDALALMEKENSNVAERGTEYQTPSKKQVNRILTVIEKTEFLMGEFFKNLARVDRKFDAVSQTFFNKAEEISASIKNPTEEQQKLIFINVAAGIAVKGMGNLWQAFQTERQLRGILQTYANEAEERMPYIGMLIDWLESAGDIAFARLLDSNDIEAAETNLDIYRSLDYTFRLACYLYSVYDSSLIGEFTQRPYPTIYDVNRTIVADLAHIETKDTEAEQLEANRSALSNVANRIKSVMLGETELPELIDVLIASDDELMATAINMGMPNPDAFDDYEDEEEDQTSHFPLKDNGMLPESTGYFIDYVVLKGSGDAHRIAEKVNANNALDILNGYWQEFQKNQKQYDSRWMLYGVNCLLLGAVTFMLFFKVWDLEWYWSLLVGIVICIIGLKVMPYSKLHMTCRNKAILLERELISVSKTTAGFMEVTDFHQLRKKNNMVFLFAIIGGAIGIFTPIPPVGCLIGAALGSIIGWFIKIYKSEVGDWREISIGSGWKAKLCFGILSLGLLYLILCWWLGWTPFKGNKVSDKPHQASEVVEVVADGPEVEEAVEVVEASSPEMDAVKDLYRIFYIKEGEPGVSVSRHMKERFEEYGISSSVQNPFTPSLQTEIERMEAIAQEVGDLSFGFDSDILHFGQGDIVDLNLGVYDITKIDDNTFSIRTLYHNMEDYERTFIMKKVNGSYRIDDMDNIRAIIKEESAKAREYLKESGQTSAADGDGYGFSGKIGDYPIELHLNVKGYDVSGKYAYKSTLKKYGDKPASYFYLSGNLDGNGTLNLVSKMHNSDEPFEYLTVPSMDFHNGSVITGELKNANTGHIFPLELRLE